jgi:hypothetical protein
LKILKIFLFIDVSFGIYLQPINKTLIIENDNRIRPYRPLPLFRKDTIVQHYMKPEEFKGYYNKAIGKELDDYNDSYIEEFYELMAKMKLMKK